MSQGLRAPVQLSMGTFLSLLCKGSPRPALSWLPSLSNMPLELCHGHRKEPIEVALGLLHPSIERETEVCFLR